MTFAKGISGNPGGRRKGSPNKLTSEVKTAIERAFKELGGWKWLVEQAKADPQPFITLLGKVVPRDIALEHNAGPTLLDLIEQSIHRPGNGT